MTSKRERELSKAGQDGYHEGYSKPMEELTTAYDYGFKKGESGAENDPDIRPWLRSTTHIDGRLSLYWKFQNYAYEAGFRDGREKYCAEMDRIYDEVQKRVRFDTNRTGYVRPPIPKPGVKS